MTWHKLLERVCDAPVTSAPRAAGETRQYVYDEYDEYVMHHVYGVHVVHDVYDLNARTLTPGKRSPTAGGSTMEPECAVGELPDACE